TQSSVPVESRISRPIVNLPRSHFTLIVGTLLFLLMQFIANSFGAPTIRVTCKDPETRPVAKVEVQLKLGDKVIETRFTDANGVAEFSGVLAGIYNITTWKEGYHELPQTPMTVSPGASQEI